MFHNLTFKQSLRYAVDKGAQSEEWYGSYGAFFRLDIPQILEVSLAPQKHPLLETLCRYFHLQ